MRPAPGFYTLGHDLQCTLYGKPYAGVYAHAEEELKRQAAKIGLPAVRTVYMIGTRRHGPRLRARPRPHDGCVCRLDRGQSAQ